MTNSVTNLLLFQSCRTAVDLMSSQRAKAAMWSLSGTQYN